MQRSQTIISVKRAGVAQLVELQPSKLNVASSNLVSRSKPELRGRNPDRSAYGSKRTKPGLKKIAHVAQSVERFLGKEEVHRFDSGRGLHYLFFSKQSLSDGITSSNSLKLLANNFLRMRQN